MKKVSMKKAIREMNVDRQASVKGGALQEVTHRLKTVVVTANRPRPVK